MGLKCRFVKSERYFTAGNGEKLLFLRKKSLKHLEVSGKAVTLHSKSKQCCYTTQAQRLRIDFMGKYQSGQMGQTVNLLAYAFGGSNPSLPTAPTRRIAEVAQSIEH